MAEEILITVKTDSNSANKEVDELTQSITDLNTANKALIESNKALEKAGQSNTQEYKDNAKQIEINKQKITENTASRKGLIQAIVAEEGSIKALKIQNAELIKQRDSINTQTDAGKKKIEELNSRIDQNNKVIKENVSAQEQQRLGVGAYTQGIKDAIPFFNQGEKAFQALAGGANLFGKALAATGIGLFIIALSSLIAYFKGSEEGQNRFNRALQVGGQILEVFMDLVETLGGAIFDGLGKAFTFIGDIADKAANALGINTAALKVYVNGILETADLISSTQEKINKLERDLITERAKTNAEVARLRREADETEGKARIDKINQAIALEEGLLKKEKEFAQTKLDLAKIEAEQDPTIENKKAEAEATAALINLDAQFLQETRKNNKERLKLEEEYQAELLVIKQNADALDRARVDQNHLIQEESLRNTDTKQVEIKTSLATLNNQAQKKIDDQNVADRKKSADIKFGIEKSLNENILNSANLLSGALIGLAKKDSTASRALALVQIVTNTAIGVAKAVSAGAGLVWPANLAAIASGVAAVFAGISQAKQVIGFALGGLIEGFATGGSISGTKIGANHGTPITRSNGDNRLVTVKTGEVILNERQQRALGGDRTFSSIGVPGFATGGVVGSVSPNSNTNLSLSQIQKIVEHTVANMPPIFVAVEDINTAQGQRARVIEGATL